jgi:hypothetical protein
MNKLLILTAAICVLFATSAMADTYVKGYTRSDGTQVGGHYRSSPNSTVTDNYSYSGNRNPHTGSTGSNRYEHDTTSPYYSGPDSRGNAGHSYR